MGYRIRGETTIQWEVKLKGELHADYTQDQAVEDAREMMEQRGIEDEEVELGGFSVEGQGLQVRVISAVEIEDERL